MTSTTALIERQLWGLTTALTSISIPHCTPFTLPSGGLLALPSTTYSLTDDAVWVPQCSPEDFAATADGSPAAIADLRDPFYASVTPQVYVIAATTVIAWILVLMLIITPRTSFFGAGAAQPGFSQGHGIIGGAHGGAMSIIGVGSRPWLQKAAALTVAISLTIATADTFQVAQYQYNVGYMDAKAMREEVIGSLEIRITRIISDVFVWLAQVQTLIRLFPRHKEKVLIKWIGFGLIICDTTFSCLNSFLANTTRAPRYFVDAIPALSYVFELALGLLYAAWVIYYAITKRRYAFYHSNMKSITLISLLSLVAILTPVVFFIIDVSNPELASWGDYFRWVGAAAASVVVWEWVERIEAIERDEKKDGILGREIYDDDDYLGDLPSDDIVFSSHRRRRGGRSRRNQRSQVESSDEKYSAEQTHQDHELDNIETHDHAQHESTTTKLLDRRNVQSTANESVMPRPLASPISRTDTSSATSTVYVVRSEPAADVPQPIRRRPDPLRLASQQNRGSQLRTSINVNEEKAAAAVQEDEDIPATRSTPGRWTAVTNPFKRKRASPPAEVQKAQREAMSANDMARAATPKHNFSRWDIKNRFGVLAADAGDIFWQKVGKNESDGDDGDHNVIVIPAQPRGSGRTWSPALLDSNGFTSQQDRARHNSEGTSTSSQHVSPEASGSSSRARHNS